MRWIIGPVNDSGFEALAESVRLVRHIYKERFDLLICHNQQDERRLSMLEKIGCGLHAQNEKDFHLPVVFWEGDYKLSNISSHPTRACWKLYPPRMRLDSHEIIMDNDIVIAKAIPQIEEFLSRGDACMLTEAIGRNYGAFESMIPKPMKLNSGVIGMPPGYDIARSVTVLCRVLHGRWNSYFDDQGLIAAAMCRRPLIVIPRTVLEICFEHLSSGVCGYHFVAINYSDKNVAWSEYQRRKIAMA